MTPEQITNYLMELEKKLCSKAITQRIVLTRDWTKQFPSIAGVYLIRENGKICYVGETGSLRERMRDLLNTQNHVIRRSIGNSEYKDHEGFEKATSRKRFISEIEAKLKKWIEDQLEISTLEVAFGRKEFEEYLYDKYKPKYNNKGKRTSKY